MGGEASNPAKKPPDEGVEEESEWADQTHARQALTAQKTTLAGVVRKKEWDNQNHAIQVLTVNKSFIVDMFGPDELKQLYGDQI